MYEILSHLRRDLSQYLRCQVLCVALELVEWHELHDIPWAFYVALRVRQSPIPVESDHVLEILIPDPHYYYRHWQIGILYYYIDCGVHVMNLAIRQNQQYLVTIAAHQFLSVPECFFKEWGEVRGAIETHIIHRIDIGIHDILKSLNVWVGRVIVDGETMIHLILVYPLKTRDGPEPEGGYLLIRIVILNNIPYAFENELILSRLLHNIMQGVYVFLGVSIRT